MKSEKTIRVWDPGIRLFHWGLFTVFTLSYLSGEMHDLHTWAGYTLLGLLLFRLVWGFAGSGHARFAAFLYGPRAVLAYLNGLASGHPPDYVGHNPVGGWMVYIMLVVLLLISFTGLKALAQEGEGPFATNHFKLISAAQAHGNETHSKPPLANSPDRSTEPSGSPEPVDEPRSTSPQQSLEDRGELFWSNTHSLLVNLMLLLVGIHIAGVIVSSILHRENLVRAMITGNKRRPK